MYRAGRMMPMYPTETYALAFLGCHVVLGVLGLALVAMILWRRR